MIRRLLGSSSKVRTTGHSRRRQAKPAVDALESRRLLAADYAFAFVNVGGNLAFQITGTDASDTIEISLVGRSSYSFDAYQTDNPDDGPSAGDLITPTTIALGKAVLGLSPTAVFQGFIVSGGGGDDSIDASTIKVSLTADGGDGNDVINGGTANDALTGGDGDDSLSGGAGADSLDAGAGDDDLSGGAGADSLDAGTGNDTVSADYQDTSIRGGTGGESIDEESGGVIGDTVDFSESRAGVTFSNIDFEHVIGSKHADRIDNSNYAGRVEDLPSVQQALFAVEILGGLGNDVLIGGASDETIDGGAGNDTVSGGTGTDRLIGGAGNDTLSYADSVAGVDVNLATATAAGGAADGDTIGEFENITGSAFDDTLTGDGGNNVLDGGDGNDALSGLAGNDTLYGRAGNDDLVGGAGNDYLEAGAGDDSVAGGAGTDTIAQDYADVTSFVATRSLNGDKIYGQDGSDAFLFLNVPITIPNTVGDVIAALNSVNDYLNEMSHTNATDYAASRDKIDLRRA